jgi:hypothetical protein
MIYLKVGDLINFHSPNNSEDAFGYVSKVTTDYYYIYYLKSEMTLHYVRRDAHKYICLMNE